MPNLEILRTPDFQYSGFFFPEIAARLRRFMRGYAPEITNEDLREPFIQLERAFALMAHYNNVLLDMMANEVFLATARLPESVKYHLANIDYKMLPASPGQVEILGKMARTYATPLRLLEANRKFATLRNEDEDEIVFENLDPLETDARTDQLRLAYGVQEEKTGVLTTSSLDADIVTYVSGGTFVTADLHKMMEITGSVLGNNIEDARITELLDETTPGSGVWNQARLSGASFVSESNLSFTIRAQTTNGAPGLVAATGFVPYSTPPTPGSKFYIGHDDVMWDRLDFVFAAAAALGIEARWEFYDPTETVVQPDLITVDPSPGVLRFDLNGLLGIESAKGAHIRVQHVPSGFEINGVSDFSGGTNFVDIQGYLGQTTPSTVEADYLVYCDWRPIDITEDGTMQPGQQTLTQNGALKYNLPQTASDEWTKFSLYDRGVGELKTGFFLRCRVVDNPGSAAGPNLQSAQFTNGSQYIIFDAVQGKTVEDAPLGSSSGEASQEFTITRSPYILNSMVVYVDEGGGDIQWTETDSFLTSFASDRHYVVDVQTDGSAKIIFGDGINGRIPPIGTNNITAVYRVGAQDDGNIANEILTINRDGVGVFTTVLNPRAGAFWVEADWDSIESLEKVKRTGPFSLRTMSRAVTARDSEILAAAFVDESGVRPVARARAYEESFGPKTVELVVAGQGGAALPQNSRTSLEEFFNGGETYDGVLVLNHELTVTNYTARQIAIEMEVVANSVVTEAMVIQTLSFLLSPTATESDGVTYVWQFGQEVPLSRIISEIFKISPGNVFKVTITSPTSDIGMSARELPIFDPINTNVVVLPPSF
jgi:hypothetical protein